MTGSAVVLQSGGVFGTLLLFVIEAVFALGVALALFFYAYWVVLRRVSPSSAGTSSV